MKEGWIADKNGGKGRFWHSRKEAIVKTPDFRQSCGKTRV
jgi:hypothetical protein